ncbi:hypothetical protein MJ585_23230 [Klebsiella pneumoniae]|nr:hypothetical protein MJ585_23230 [Klebsiella pneumoniae]
MLMRMYLRWAGSESAALRPKSSKNPKVKSRDSSLTGQIIGDYAYGWLRTEAGDSSSVRRARSIPAAAVIPPSAPRSFTRKWKTISISKINPADLRDVYRASGARWIQHVNRTESAVRITHIPTGLVTQCQNDPFAAQEQRPGHEAGESKALCLEI